MVAYDLLWTTLPVLIAALLSSIPEIGPPKSGHRHLATEGH
ncbi:hypothetical protein SAMN04515648_3071 [Phyllobacterium sp. CL33Tsu]|nr:hypothetical protein SAMN04515648_3071 [Phyllobacterium sp. CL33Tsu]